MFGFSLRHDTGAKWKQIYYQEPMSGRHRRNAPGIDQLPRDHVRERSRRGGVVQCQHQAAPEELRIENGEETEQSFWSGLYPAGQLAPFIRTDLLRRARLAQGSIGPRGLRASDSIFFSGEARRNCRG